MESPDTYGVVVANTGTAKAFVVEYVVGVTLVTVIPESYAADKIAAELAWVTAAITVAEVVSAAEA